MNSIYTIVLLVVSLLTALGVIFMEPLLSSLFEGTPFAEVEGKLSMAITMARLLFLYLFLVVLYAYFMGIAHALGKFFIPAVAPAFLNIFMILFAFFTKRYHSFSCPAFMLRNPHRRSRSTHFNRRLAFSFGFFASACFVFS